MADSNRPLSPHLQVYRWQLTMFLSITHRATGMVLSAGVVFLIYWVWAVTSGEVAYDRAVDLLSSGLGRAVLLVLSFSFFYHLCNGIRHLFWDIGKGLKLETVYLSGWIMVVTSLVLTLITWLAAYAQGGYL